MSPSVIRLCDIKFHWGHVSCCAAKVGPLDKKWAAEDRLLMANHMAAAQTHLDANDELIRSSSESLDSKIEKAAFLAQTLVRFLHKFTSGFLIMRRADGDKCEQWIRRES